ncbi:hypothetical protein GCM10010218_56300 [Streptomyces mashuensis]|uniref:Uncharacterized protein n=1 Tax=Streptomyces mashuensis TaxID=33904 RepID=A0A919EG05_9ACTN|nr:hypothetical protein GCM10010218_56300 [Streptomyces mashuensis]
MRRISIALAAVLVAGAAALSPAAVAQAAPSGRVPADNQPPWPYADCLKAAKQHKESPKYARWHCDELVKKGWIKPPLPSDRLQPSEASKASKPSKPSKHAKAAKPAKHHKHPHRTRHSSTSRH